MTLHHDFNSLGLSQRMLDAVAKAGFEKPTPIQAQAIPPGLAGKDVVGCAATGTGKTAAFALPLLERIAGKKGTRALVLAPTRELALQIGEEMERFGKTAGVRCAVVIGGVGMNPQIQAFRAGVEIIIATPGRLNDHLDQGTARLDAVEALVLDEADRMLDMGFKPQLERILRKLPRTRQTMLFSATMAGEVADFAAAHLKDPVRIEVARSGTTAQRAVQRVFTVSQDEKTALLLALLAEDGESTLVFTRTKRRADRVAEQLQKAGHEVARIHANRSQGQRRHALDGFKDGTYRVLVATDIAARGIDVAEIGHVVNFDLPHVPEDYVHRIGRTARAEASGRASSFASPEEMELLRGIEKLTRAPVPRATLPDSEVFQAEAARAKERRKHAPARGAGLDSRGGGAGHGGARPGRHGAHARRGAGAPRHKGGHGGGQARSGGGAGGQGGAASSGAGGDAAAKIGSWRPKRHR
ncbi:MAG: ATP-dependent RNA helicase RhlE [Myxococcales bacterium]